MKEIKDKIFSEQTGFYLTCFSFILLCLSIIVFLVCGNWKFSTILNEEKIGQFGDFVGGVIGSIFALTGVILYYVALKEQRKDIEINREALNLQIDALKQQVNEFKAQKEELAETRKVYEEQTTLFREQTEYYKLQAREYKLQTSLAIQKQFDSSFYSLLHLLIDIRQNLNLTNKRYFDSIYQELMTDFSEFHINKACHNVYTRYENIYQNHSDDLLPFFKTIYRILSFIDEGGTEIKKYQYAQILRSQLTDKELLILHYNYHSMYGEGARNLALKYSILKDIKQLDKIELGIHNISAKDQLSLYSQNITKVINNNIEKYNDITITDNIDVNEKYSFLNFDSWFHLIIDDDLFSFSVSFRSEDWPKIESLLTENLLKILFEGLLYDLFFISQFRIPRGDEFERTTIDHEKSKIKELKFEANITNIFK